MSPRTLPLVIAALLSPTVLAQEILANVETIKVRGLAFNDYKNDSASGALRGDIPLLSTPQSVTVIPEIVIDEQLATTLGEVLGNDASVTAGSKKWNREVFNLRGFELASGNGYLRNGHQHWSHYVQPMETLERIEVLKGPSSMLYGQSAPGGLINMVSKKPTHERFAELAFDVDGEGGTRYQLDAGGRIDDEGHVRYRGVLVKQDSVYSRTFQNGEQNERDRLLGYLNLEADLGGYGMLSAHYDRTQDKAGIDRGAWLDGEGQVIGERDMIWDMPWSFTDNDIENYGADLHLYLSTDWDLKLGYNQQDFYRQRFDSSPNYERYDADSQSYQYRAFDREDDWQFTTYYVDLTGHFTTGAISHQLLVGANALRYFYQTRRDQGSWTTQTIGTSTPIMPDLDFNRVTKGTPTEYDYYGLYLQDLITLNDQWQVLIGGRFDRMSQDIEGGNSQSFLPRAGLIFHPMADASLYLNYSESFEPNSSVTDEDDANYGLLLDPTIARAWELGGKWDLNEGRLLLSGALFDIEMTDMVMTRSLPGVGDDETDQITRQGGKQRHRGVELSAQGQVTEHWFVMGSMMYLDAEYIEHDEYQDLTPIDAPEWTASLWSRYQLNDAAALNLGLTYEGERFANLGEVVQNGQVIAGANGIVKDAYVRLDAGASYRTALGSHEINLRLNVENLLDTDYIGGGSYSDVSLGEGRMLRLATTISL
ncbi:TonB-dependent receptor [Ferrimonas pelagia]|uniref:TonB-dependent receptor n=1 Tax=Ferrimonas pelagia TaxID=1177826 RepID=A0ABP9F3Z7_9GAMM